MADSLLNLPKALFRASQVRDIDALAIKQSGNPSLNLMQAAGAKAFEELRGRWPHVRFIRIFAGIGNNAGDGFVLAALAKEHQINCEIIAVGDTARLVNDALTTFQQAQALGIPVQSLAQFLDSNSEHDHVVNVDAILGTGLEREVTGDFAQAISALNHSKAPTMALDLPSGLNANTGMPMGGAVMADLTVTFVAMKQGLLTGKGRDYCGEIRFADLNIPTDILDHSSLEKVPVKRIDINDALKSFYPRKASAHKGSNGHVLVVGGDYGFGGAAIMAAESALRSGAGLVSVITRSINLAPLLSRCPEIMTLGTEDSADEAVSVLFSRASVIVIGPGLGRGEWAQRLLMRTLSESRARDIPLVLDADALHLLEDRLSASATNFPNRWLMTPHPGEAAALLNTSIADIQNDRFAAIANLRDKYSSHCLLKGSGSLVASPQSPDTIFLSTEGNPGMATAGMGDILSGIAGGLLAQGMDELSALKTAVCLHGEAADLAADKSGQRGLRATDLLAFLRLLVNPQ